MAPDGHDVVERHQSSDMVVDWLEAPPPGADAWVSESVGDHAGDADASDLREAGITHAEAASGSGSGAATSPGSGFSVFSPDARLLPAGYAIRLTGSDPRVAELRDELEAAAAGASAASGIPVRVVGLGGPAVPARGEITVVVGSGPCGEDATGCGGPLLTSTEIVAGRVWISSAALTRADSVRRNLATHELGHALGLGHFGQRWGDGLQAMYPRVTDVTSYRAGDSNGLRHLAGADDQPAGALSGIGYAAGRITVAGTLASGSRARVVAGADSVDVTATSGRFSAVIAARAGTHRVCASSLDAAAGFRRALGCADIVAPGAPFGRLEAAVGSFETVQVSGWAIDPQTADPIAIEVRRNGELVHRGPAAGSRSDVAAAHPAYGPRHGFGVSIPAVAGPNELCVRVLGTGGGGDHELGCRTVAHAVDPVGVWESVVATPTGVAVSGWALDPNTVDAVTVRATVDGTVPVTPGDFRSDDERSDVAAEHRAHGPAHGFTQDLVLPDGNHRLCLTAQNEGLGADRSLGCTDVQVRTTTSDVGTTVREPGRLVDLATDSASALAHGQPRPTSAVGR